jgi:hypothetical protein
MNATATQLVTAVRALGSDAEDARDAAHEACHALEWGVTKRWTRDNIHARRPRTASEKTGSEILARAVEAIVCKRLGIKYPVKKWAFMCWMEMLKNERISLPAGPWLENAIRNAMTTKRTARFADRVLGLVRR